MANASWDNMIDIDEEFTRRVYAEVAKIPYGRLTTYGIIAELAGYPKASREVGIAMSRVPAGSDLPCHRKVNKNGTFAPSTAFGGKERQREMLLAEGITFLPDGLIRVERHLWPDDPGGEQLTFF